MTTANFRTIVFEKLGQQCPGAARPQHIPERARCAEEKVEAQEHIVARLEQQIEDSSAKDLQGAAKGPGQ